MEPQQLEPESDDDRALRAFVVEACRRGCNENDVRGIIDDMHEVLEGHLMQDCITAMEYLLWQARGKFSRNLTEAELALVRLLALK